MRGPGALQHVASPSQATSWRAAREGVQIDLSGWPAAPRKPPSLWKMRALFKTFPAEAGISSGLAACHKNAVCMAGAGSAAPLPWGPVPGPPAPGVAWPRLLSARQSDGSVSARQRGGTGAALHSGLRSLPVTVPGAAGSQQTAPLFCRNVHSLEIRCCLQRFSFRDKQEMFAKTLLWKGGGGKPGHGWKEPYLTAASAGWGCCSLWDPAPRSLP